MKFGKGVGGFIGYLSQSLAKGGSETTMYLSSLTTITGEAVTTADIAVLGKGEITIDPLVNNTLEFCTFTGVDSGAVSLTGLTRGLSALGDDVATSRKFYHPVGTLVIISFGVQSIESIYQSLSPYKYWALPVANYAALPAGVADGETRVTLDDSKVYVWDSVAVIWNLAGAGGGAGTVYVTTKLGTEADGDDNKTFSLSSGSFSNDKYLQVYVNGILMENGASADYVTSGGNKAVFNNVVLDTDKITMIVVSVDLSSAPWNAVDADLLPTDDDTYNIGSATKQFKDIFITDTTSGTPSSTTNELVDKADVASAKTANKIARRDANGDVLVSTTPTSGDAATSKTYTDLMSETKTIIGDNTTTTVSVGFVPRKVLISMKGSSGNTISNSDGVGYSDGTTFYVSNAYGFLGGWNDGSRTDSSSSDTYIGVVYNYNYSGSPTWGVQGTIKVATWGTTTTFTCSGGFKFVATFFR